MRLEKEDHERVFFAAAYDDYWARGGEGLQLGDNLHMEEHRSPVMFAM